MKMEDREAALMNVYRAAWNLRETWVSVWPSYWAESALSDALEAAEGIVSLDEDRGLRDPGTPGEQETGPEQAHQPDPHH